MIKLSMYTSYGKRNKSINFQGERSNFKVTGNLYKIWHLDPCGQDIPRTMQSPCSNLVCTLHMEVEKAIEFQGQGYWVFIKNFGTWVLVCLSSEINKTSVILKLCSIDFLW